MIPILKHPIRVKESKISRTWEISNIFTSTTNLLLTLPHGIASRCNRWLDFNSKHKRKNKLVLSFKTKARSDNADFQKKPNRTRNK
jgi:hypothetical protein